MTNDPSVSVVIPCYNSASTLRETLDSALGQTYGNVQIIAINDGSTDETGDILIAYGDRITVLSQQNAGQTVAKINGIAQATLVRLTDRSRNPDSTNWRTSLARVSGWTKPWS